MVLKYKEHLQFFRIAFSSGAELETQLSLSKDLKYISEKEYIEATQLLDEVIFLHYNAKTKKEIENGGISNITNLQIKEKFISLMKNINPIKMI